MGKFVFLVLAIVLVLGSQGTADAAYGQGHGGTLGTQGHVTVGGERPQASQSEYGQVGQVPHGVDSPPKGH